MSHHPTSADGTEVLAAFTRIRVAAEDHMDERDRSGLPWGEETVTEIATSKGLPLVKVIPFHRNQEGHDFGVGADYLWWFVERSTGHCFGMLVQAKRLKVNTSGRFTVDYKQQGKRQLDALVATADHLQVPAMYAVYTGGRVLRAETPCFHGGTPEECLSCRRMAISMMSTYAAELSLGSPRDAADEVLTTGTLLEDLVDPEKPAGPIRDMNLSAITDSRLRSFLLEPTTGPLEVARRIFAAVSVYRSGSLSAAAAELAPTHEESLFSELPDDTGHFRGPYFDHFLRGVRPNPPDYVRTLMTPPRRPRDDWSDVLGYQTTTMNISSIGPAGQRRRPPRKLRGLALDGVALVLM